MNFKWIILFAFIGLIGVKIFNKDVTHTMSQIPLNESLKNNEALSPEPDSNNIVIKESNIANVSPSKKEDGSLEFKERGTETPKKTFYPETLDAIREEFRFIPLDQREEQIKALRENNIEFRIEIEFLNELRSLPYAGPKPPEPEEDLSNEIVSE